MTSEVLTWKVVLIEKINLFFPAKIREDYVAMVEGLCDEIAGLEDENKYLTERYEMWYE